MSVEGEADGSGYVADRALFERTHPGVPAPMPFAEGVRLTLGAAPGVEAG